MNTLKQRMPNWLKDSIRTVRAKAYAGEGRYCPICEKSARKFLTAGRETREDSQCPHCLSFERQRFLLLYLLRRTDLFNSRLENSAKERSEPILHVSPAACLEPKFKARFGDRYLTADLLSPTAMVKMDITNIQYPDQSFPAILCSHVLEHVSNDIAAMREFYRVLKDDGWAILLVPITADRTFEDPSIADPAKRLELFGEIDHVRRYGPDYVDRLRSVGFKVETIFVEEVASAAEIEKMRLTADSGEIYLCRK